MADPVAWTVIERGWPVYDAEGDEIGKVHEIAGDENHDIFDGLDIKEGVLGHDKYVPAEVVGRIEEGAVHLSITGNEVAKLADMRSAPEEQVIPESSTWYQRLAWWLAGRNR
jgi:uncharacterized protein YrrD